MLHLLCLGASASLFSKSTPRIGALELHPSNITEYVLPDQTPKAPLIASSLLLESLKKEDYINHLLASNILLEDLKYLQMLNGQK